MSKWLTRAQVAEKLGIHPNTIFRLEKRPEFPQRSEVLGNPRWRDDEIEKFMERGREGDDSEGMGSIREPAISHRQNREASAGV